MEFMLKTSLHRHILRSSGSFEKKSRTESLSIFPTRALRVSRESVVLILSFGLICRHYYFFLHRNAL